MLFLPPSSSSALLLLLFSLFVVRICFSVGVSLERGPYECFADKDQIFSNIMRQPWNMLHLHTRRDTPTHTHTYTRKSLQIHEHTHTHPQRCWDCLVFALSAGHLPCVSSILLLSPCRPQTRTHTHRSKNISWHNAGAYVRLVFLLFRLVFNTWPTHAL